MKSVITFLFLGALALPVYADCHKSVVVNKVAVAACPAVIATFVPIAVPQYSVGYVAGSFVSGSYPNYSQPQVNAQYQGGYQNNNGYHNGQNQNPNDLGAKIAELERQLAECKAKLGSGNNDQVDPNPVIRTLQEKCAKCHDASVSHTEGKGLTLFQDGRLAKIDELLARKIASKTYLGKMPKNGKLTDEEVASIQEWADSIK